MYEYLVKNPILAIIFIVIVVALAIFLMVKLIQKVGLEKVREVAYKGFVEAENEFLYGENTEKFDFVVDLAKKSIPLPFSLFITDTLLRKVIQLWFDLLDDGKLDSKKEE